MAENTITDRNELLAELAEIRETGVAFSAEESSNGMRSVASPIFDPDNEVIGSICVSGPKTRLEDDVVRGVLPEKLEEATNIVEIKLINESRLV